MRLSRLLFVLTVWSFAAARGDVDKSGTLGTETWTAAQGPYRITATVTVASGATLTIEPGTQVHLASGANFIVASAGRLLAEGTASQPIRFSRVPGGANWGSLRINGAAGTPETRLAYAQIEGNGSSPAVRCTGATVLLDHLSFETTNRSYVHVDGSSFVVSNCIFPRATAEFESLHGTGGVKPGGYGIVRDCFFGPVIGYNDVIDFTGGSRPGPILQLTNNVFMGSDDDIVDLDGTDAWIEGNIFLHAHRNGSPDSSSAVSGGKDQGSPAISRITVIGNLFFDVDQVATAKQGNFYVLLNNTVVHQTHLGSEDTFTALVNLTDFEPGGPGAGLYLEGNIVVDAEALVRNYDAAASIVTLKDNILPLPWSGPGSGNVLIDPQLRHLPTLAETGFSTFESAQVMREWLRPRPGSLATGTGPNGSDKGGVVPLGVTVSGAPQGTTRSADATLAVGPNRAGSGIPAAGFPNGAGFTHYRWRLDGGALSAEEPIATPIVLSGLANGPHTISVAGKNDAGFYQDDPRFGQDARVTTASWIVDTSLALDSDGDGLSDAWETTYNFDRQDPATAAADADGDGRSNRAEYLAGTNPRDPGSNLNLRLSTWDAATHVVFAAERETSYRVQYTPDLVNPAWVDMGNISPGATRRVVDLRDSFGAPAQRFYRVVIPPGSVVGFSPRDRRARTPGVRR